MEPICLLNDSFPPQIDGVANAIKNYAACIHGRGGNPMVVVPSHPKADDGNFPFPIVRYPSVNFRKLDGYTAGIPFSPEVARRVTETKPALLHSHCPIMSTVMARQLRQITNAPIVLTYHTKFDVDIANIIEAKPVQIACKKILTENIRACDEIWTVSRGAGENLHQLGYEGEFFVMPNGVDLPRLRVPDDLMAQATAGYDLPAGVPVYLFVGRLMWYKGIRIILDALAGLHRDYRMVFIGTGNDDPQIQEYARRLGIAGQCIFTGAVHDRTLLQAWYTRADLFLFPSAFDTNGLVVREAAASSLPAVLLRGSCAAEDVTDGQNCFLIEENAESLRALLEKTYGNQLLLRQVGNAASRELYLSWQQAVAMALDRYQIVIDRYRTEGPRRRHQPMDLIMKWNAEVMDAMAKLSEYLHSRNE